MLHSRQHELRQLLPQAPLVQNRQPAHRFHELHQFRELARQSCAGIWAYTKSFSRLPIGGLCIAPKMPWLQPRAPQLSSVLTNPLRLETTLETTMVEPTPPLSLWPRFLLE